MLASSIFFAFALSAVGIAQEVDNNDVPNECRDVCASIVTLARQCGDQFDGDREELNCICSATGVNSQLPLCEACVAQFNDDDDDDIHDTDMGELLRDCSFTTTSYASSAASASVTNIQGSASLTTPSVTNAQSTDAPQTSTVTEGSQTSTVTGVPGQATEDSGSQPTEGGAAPLPTVGAMGVGLGVLGFAMGIL